MDTALFAHVESIASCVKLPIRGGFQLELDGKVPVTAPTKFGLTKIEINDGMRSLGGESAGHGGCSSFSILSGAVLDHAESAGNILL